MDKATGEPLGVINWFAVHPTSMNNTNHLISGDNKGVASQMLERHVNGAGFLSGTVSQGELGKARFFPSHNFQQAPKCTA